MESQSSRLAMFASCLLSLCLLFGCDAKQLDDDKTSFVRPVKLFEIGVADEAGMLSYPAVIQAQELTVLAFEVGGLLKELRVIESQHIEQGDILATIDQRDLLSKLSSVEAQFENAELEYRRAERLIKEDAVSRSVLQQRKAQRNVTRSQLETAQKALDDSVLIAPYTGLIAKISITERQIVQAGKPAITIFGEGRFEATINLPARIIANSRQRKASTAKPYIVLDAAPQRNIPAYFEEVSLEADAASQTYAATLSFDVPDDLVILPGMNAVVWFRDPANTSNENQRVSIPLAAIAVDGEDKFVWVLDKESMTVSRRDVTIKAGVGEKLDVSTGLETGETIVAAGVSLLSEGMKIRPWSK